MIHACYRPNGNLRLVNKSTCTAMRRLFRGVKPDQQDPKVKLGHKEWVGLKEKLGRKVLLGQRCDGRQIRSASLLRWGK